MFFEPEDKDILSEGIRYKMNIIPFLNADFIEQSMIHDLWEEED